MKEVKKRLSRTFLVLTVLLTLSYLVPSGLSANYSQSYQLLDHPGGSKYYRLNVEIQQSLYDYYVGKSHSLSSPDDFAKFVTPYALQPIAKSLWQIYPDDESFANGVLMIVHQIPYSETIPSKYPVETMVENKGDCDLFSFIAASIMKAGGLDVILLYYKNEAHMNLAVSLPHEPYYARGGAYSVTCNGVTYYVSECTGGNWQIGWRVGECPDDLKQALKNAQSITLENCEQWAPGQVSASYENLVSSTISLTVSSTFLLQGGTVTLSGKLSPALQNKTITIYAKVNGSPWIVLGNVTTDSSGQFTYVWSAETAGVGYIRASWSGDDAYAGADSPTLTVTVLSTFFIVLLVITIILVGIGVAIFVMSRKNQPAIQEPPPPGIPS
jgi:hypothetical protein